MSSFSVDEEELSGLPRLLDRASEDALAGRKYVQDNNGLAGGEGWLNQLSGAHDTIMENTLSWLGKLHDPALSGYAGSVERALAHYRTTDQSEAERLDAAAESYGNRVEDPQVGPDYHRSYGGTKAFGDTSQPQDHYQAVPDYDTHEEFQYEPSYTDLASVSGLGRGAVIKSTEFLASVGWLDRSYDPYELVQKPVVGDWAGFRGIADVLNNVANAASGIAANLLHARLSIDGCWQGNAADACAVHMDRLRSAISDAAWPLREMAQQYQEAAQGQADFRAAVGQLLSDLIDAAAVLATAIAAGGATSWTGIGGVIGGLVGLSEAYVICDKINDIVGWYNRINNMMQSIEGSMNSFGQLQASEYQLPELPQVQGGDSTLGALPSS